MAPMSELGIVTATRSQISYSSINGEVSERGVLTLTCIVSIPTLLGSALEFHKKPELFLLS